MSDLVQKLVGALEGMLALDEEDHQRYPGDEDVCKEVRDARAAISEAKAGGWVTVPVDAPRNREDDRARFPDPDFNRWLDEAITENGEYTAWHALKSTGDAYAGWCVRPDYTSPEPDGHALVPVQPSPEMIEAARDVKRQRLVHAAAELKQGKRPDTIGMAMSVNEEWAAMLAARPLTAPPAQKEPT